MFKKVSFFSLFFYKNYGALMYFSQNSEKYFIIDDFSGHLYSTIPMNFFAGEKFPGLILGPK